MRSAEVLMHGIPAGILEELETGKKYRFIYYEKYIGPSIALTMPVDGREFVFDRFPPFFDGLLPEGLLLEGLLRVRKIDKLEYLKQLIAVGNDLVGAVTVRGENGMSRCPITYEECEDGKYSPNGLKKLSPRLKDLKDFPFSAEDQVKEAIARAAKMSIQGVQPKLSVRLDLKNEIFEIVDTGGRYILKPQTQNYREVPENEDVTMRLAELIGIDVPLHGLVFSKDNTLTYFIRRFDRVGRNKKIAVEDFAQLSGKDRGTKYDSSMEQIISLINQFCTFPAIEKLKLFNLTLFNYLVGNKDMHLKNYSVIRRDLKVKLSPAYDLLNSTIIIKSREELALSLRGKKNKLKKDDFFVYFAKERLGLTQKSIGQTAGRIVKAFPRWTELVRKSFLSDSMKTQYIDLLNERFNKLDLRNSELLT